MNTIETIRRRAAASCKHRGHRITWEAPFVHRGHLAQNGSCKCKAWVQIMQNPAPNGIDVGGPAVAIGCRN